MFPSSNSNHSPARRVLVACCWLLLGLPGTGSGLAAEFAAITNAAEVQSLNAAQAAEARPVRLRAVVVDESAPREFALLVADDTGGVYLLAAKNIFAPFHRGDLLDLTGTTDPGQYAPIVIVSAVKKIGTAALPPPRPVTYNQIVSGAIDAQWIEISGIVRQFEGPRENVSHMAVSLDGNLVHVRLIGAQQSELQVDAEVHVQAICFYQFNQKRQMVSPVLQVPAGIQVTVTKPAPTNPFDAPVRLAANLRQFSPVNTIGHRIHVRGVVTHAESGAEIWIRDESAGLRIQSRTPDALEPGDVIDVLGFPRLDTATPSLEDAVFQKISHTKPPQPAALTNPTNAFDYADDLVSIVATLKDITRTPENLNLTLDLNGLLVKAVLKLPAATTAPPDWQPGSLARITGICSVIFNESLPRMGIWSPSAFELKIRSPQDLVVLQSPSWWTLKHIAYLLAIALTITLIVASIITMQARRHFKEQQQHRLMAEAEFAAILSERNRVAREIHDTLAQGLVATLTQLRVVQIHVNAADEEAHKHLHSAQQLVQSTLQEARQSIWNMRPQLLEKGDLAEALKTILKQTTDGESLETEFTVTGTPRRFAPVIEDNLLRIGQEAITNAARHAQARHLFILLDFGGPEFRLVIRDDGKGFDLNNLPKRDGGFGLVGMRERVKELKGDLVIKSAIHEGTEICLRLPPATNYPNG